MDRDFHHDCHDNLTTDPENEAEFLIGFWGIEADGTDPNPFQQDGKTGECPLEDLPPYIGPSGLERDHGLADSLFPELASHSPGRSCSDSGPVCLDLTTNEISCGSDLPTDTFLHRGISPSYSCNGDSPIEYVASHHKTHILFPEKSCWKPKSLIPLHEALCDSDDEDLPVFVTPFLGILLQNATDASNHRALFIGWTEETSRAGNSTSFPVAGHVSTSCIGDGCFLNKLADSGFSGMLHNGEQLRVESSSSSVRLLHDPLMRGNLRKAILFFPGLQTQNGINSFVLFNRSARTHFKKCIRQYYGQSEILEAKAVVDPHACAHLLQFPSREFISSLDPQEQPNSASQSPSPSDWKAVINLSTQAVYIESNELEKLKLQGRKKADGETS